MFAFFGVSRWKSSGWPLALGLVVSIYIHEMGHLGMRPREGIDADAPMFIPGMGGRSCSSNSRRPGSTDRREDRPRRPGLGAWRGNRSICDARSKGNENLARDCAAPRAWSQPVQPDSGLATGRLARDARGRTNGAMGARWLRRARPGHDRGSAFSSSSGQWPCGARCNRRSAQATAACSRLSPRSSSRWRSSREASVEFNAPAR